MQLREFYTVLCTDDVAGTAAFWVKHFGFRRAFEADWYVHLTSVLSDKANLAILQLRLVGQCQGQIQQRPVIGLRGIAQGRVVGTDAAHQQQHRHARQQPGEQQLAQAIDPARAWRPQILAVQGNSPCRARFAPPPRLAQASGAGGR